MPNSQRSVVFEICPSVLAVLEFDGVLVRITFTNHGERVPPQFNLNPDNVCKLGEAMVRSSGLRDFPVSGVSSEAIQALGHRLQEYAHELISHKSAQRPNRDFDPSTP
jgi:hypothetical protein